MTNLQDTIHQTNVGDYQRAAGRDFNDYSVTHYGDLESMMLTLSESELDQMSINNCDLFKRRFGKDFEKPWRKKIVDLKLEHGLTRLQTKILLLVGAMRIDYKANTVSLTHDKLLYWYALIHITMITLYSLAGSIVVYASTAPLFNQFLGQLVILMTWVLTVWVFHIVFIYPHKLLERIRSVDLGRNVQS